MAVVAHIDHVSVLEAEEEFGTLKRMVRRIRVTGLTDLDYSALFTALAAAGVPLYLSTLPEATSLVCTNRTVRLVDGDRGSVDVDCYYSHVLTLGQSFANPTQGILLGEVSTTLSQVKTNKALDGKLIQVRHRWPGPEHIVDNPAYADDPDGDEPPLLENDKDHPDETHIQGAEIEVMVPETVLTFKGIVNTVFPWNVERFLVGKVNATDWAGRGPDEWMCIGADWRPLDGEASRYEFSFSFQRKEGGWQPEVRFIDKRTDEPPPALVEGVGYKKITYYESVDFENEFGVRVQGG